ncbi:hypothetical protein Tco_1469341 [Tanacetum coccineum]
MDPRIRTSIQRDEISDSRIAYVDYLKPIVRHFVEPENQLQLHGKDSVGIIECDNKIEEILPSSIGEHDINYRPRTSIKGQILVDFIVERLVEDPLATGTMVEEKAHNHRLCSWMDLPANKDPELVKYSKAQKKHNSSTTYASNLTHPTMKQIMRL